MPGPWQQYQVKTGATSSGKPWEGYAQGQVNLPNGGQVTSVDDDFQPVDHSYSTELMKEVPGAVGQALLGAGKGLGHTIAGIPSLVSPKAESLREKYLTPSNPEQQVGYSGEQAAEFIAPGLGEEKAAALLPEKLAPAARVGYQALTSGALNKLQGGSFRTGAAAGVGTGLLGEGMRLAAPGIAEKALGMRGTDRAFGRTPGRVLLDETTGVRPETVAASAKNRIQELTPELERLTEAASTRPNPARLALPPPPEVIPLGEPGLPEMPGDLINAQRFPPQNVGEARVIRNSSGQILPKSQRVVEFPDENGKLPFGRNRRGQILSRTPTRTAFMAGEGEMLPPVGNQRVGPGILIRSPQEELLPPPPFIPNRVASLESARNVLSEAAGRASSQNAAGLHGQIGEMQNFLRNRFDTGAAIPEQLTPRELLDLKRGFSEEHLNWNPDRRDAALSAGRRAYGALDEELDRTVPEAADINQRISSLIPTARRGEAMSRGEGALPRVMERIARPAGALTGALGGGMYGYQHGGAQGAAEGAGIGLILPELMSSPTGRMIAARTFNRPLPQYLLPAARGAALQLDRGER